MAARQAVLVIGLLSAVHAGATGRVTAPARPELPADLGETGGRIEFRSPADWRCVPEAACVACRNVSGHASAVLVAQPNAPRRERLLPPGTSFRLCPPDDPQLAHTRRPAAPGGARAQPFLRFTTCSSVNSSYPQRPPS